MEIIKDRNQPDVRQRNNGEKSMEPTSSLQKSNKIGVFQIKPIK